MRYWAIYLHFAGREAASSTTTWDAQVGVEPEHPNLTYVLCERHGKDVQWMHNFYSVPNPYLCFTPFFLLLSLKKKIYIWWSFFPYPFLCIPSLLPVLKLYMKAPTKPVGFLFEYSQLTWSYLLLAIGWKIFFHTPECIIQINCRKTPMYLPCKLHLKGSLVSLGTLIHVAAEKKIVPACIPHLMCGNGSSSREQTPASLPFLERHWKAKWDWWGFTLKYQVVKHRCSAAPPQAV